MPFGHGNLDDALTAGLADGNAPVSATRTTARGFRRMHGTTNDRTISVSSSRPMHTVEPT